MNPDDKSHPRFKEVADLAPLLYSRWVYERESRGGVQCFGIHFSTPEFGHWPFLATSEIQGWVPAGVGVWAGQGLGWGLPGQQHT